jgi:hypothetical protein
MATRAVARRSKIPVWRESAMVVTARVEFGDVVAKSILVAKLCVLATLDSRVKRLAVAATRVMAKK